MTTPSPFHVVPKQFAFGSAITHALSQKLGRGPVLAEPDTPKLRAFVTGTPSVPDHFSWYSDGMGLPPDLNDKLGCCVEQCAAYLIAVRSTAAGSPTVIPSSTIEQLYELAGGYVPGQPSTDRGTNPAAMWRYWRRQGVQVPAGTVDRIAANATIDAGDAEMIRLGAYVFGGVAASWNLPQSAIDQTFSGNPWDVVDKSLKGRSAPGSWGGHEAAIVGHDTASGTYAVLTWGGVQPATEAFVAAYCVGCSTLVDGDFVLASGISPSGLNLVGLIAASRAAAGTAAQLAIA